MALLCGLRTGAPAPSSEPLRVPIPAALSEPSPLHPPTPTSHRVPTRPVALASADGIDEPSAPRGRASESEPGGTTEQEFYERFLRAAEARPGSLETEAATILRGAGPDPEKVALLRALHDRGSQRAAELTLLALDELPDVSTPLGESVPSTALLLLDRWAARDASSRALLRRAAFETPGLAPNLRCRAAASFSLHATGEELREARTDLVRERDPQVLECALEALTRNPDTETSAMLLADHGRSGAGVVADALEPR